MPWCTGCLIALLTVAADAMEAELSSSAAINRLVILAIMTFSFSSWRPVETVPHLQTRGAGAGNDKSALAKESIALARTI